MYKDPLILAHLAGLSVAFNLAYLALERYRYKARILKERDEKWREYMSSVREAIPELDPEKREAIPQRDGFDEIKKTVRRDREQLKRLCEVMLELRVNGGLAFSGAYLINTFC
jgi:hypothetical protein